MTITLLDGTQVDTGNVSFNPVTYDFTLNSDGEDLTNLITVSDKRANWPNFDITAWNNMVYNQIYAQQNEGAAPPPVGSTSTLVNFTDQILTDPLAAPLSALNTGLGQIFSTSGVWVLIALGIGGLLIFNSLKSSK